jgi:DnaJ-class molecular chaperone
MRTTCTKCHGSGAIIEERRKSEYHDYGNGYGSATITSYYEETIVKVPIICPECKGEGFIEWIRLGEVRKGKLPKICLDEES